MALQRFPPPPAAVELGAAAALDEKGCSEDSQPGGEEAEGEDQFASFDAAEDDPRSEQGQMDKACLLERVVDQVKTLKKKAMEISKGFTIPTEADEVTVMEYHGVDDAPSSRGNIIYVKASICCEDRPDLFTDLTETFNRLGLRTIRADITSLGGRVQNAFILCYKDENGSVCSSALKESLKEALGKIVSFDMAHQNELSGKRQKLIRSNCFNVSV